MAVDLVVAVRRAARASAGLHAALLAAAAADAGLIIAARGALKPADLASSLGAAVAVVAYATLGSLIVRRAGHLIGWLMLAEGAAIAWVSLGSTYAVAGIAAFPGALPAARQAATLAEAGFVGVAFTLAFMVFLFPTGTLPSRRWRPLTAAGLLLAGLNVVSLVLRPRLVSLPVPGGTSLRIPNAFGLAWPSFLASVPVGTIDSLFSMFAALLVTAFLALVARYRAGGRPLRQQVKWLALAAAVFVVAQLSALLIIALGQPWLSGVANALVAVVALFGIPAAMTIAILRERLYDIDAIISRAVAYGLLSAAFTLLYAAIVLGLGTFAGRRGGPLLTVIAAVSIAVLFQPLRRRFQRFANHLVYGERATPYQVLADFAENMAGQLDFADAVERMVAAAASAAGSDRAEAWLRVGGELRPVAVWPRDAAPSPAVALEPGGALPAVKQASRTVPVSFSGELLGALSVHQPRNEALGDAADKLLRQLASQASLLLRNAQLTADLRATVEELRASRRRLVEAQDAERRRIERNLHEGAQQRLVALSLQLGLLDGLAGEPDQIRRLTPALRDGLHAALDEVRELARGIYPPLLAEQGLVAALRAQASRTALPVSVEAGAIGRYSPDRESAVYFCVLEGLQNIAKHAAAAHAVIGLTCLDDLLTVTISDDGIGFDPATARGSGLQGMADRLAALGGALGVESRPGRGTVLTCQLPVAMEG